MARRRSTKAEPVEDHSIEDLEAVQSDLMAELDMMNDASVDHLPDPAAVGGNGWSHDHDAFQNGSTSVGRATTAPMFEHAQAFPQAKQLRVWEVKEGVPHALGVVGINASEEEFVAKFRGAMPGKFKMRPIDINGRYVGQEFTTIISPNHASLSSLFSPTSTGPVSNPSNDMLMAMLEMQREELRELRLKMDDERSQISRERMELAEERTALATNAAMGVQSVAERMMQSDQARQDQINSTLTGLFQQQISMMTAQAEMERDRARQRLAEMRQEQSFAMERERDRLSREREKEREWQTDREKERNRLMEREREETRMKERMRKAEMDASLQREREHAERMMQMSKAESGMGGVKKLLGEFGMKPADVLDLIRGDNDTDNGTIGTTIVKGITEVGKSFAEAAKANVEAQASVQASQLQAQAQVAQLQAIQQMQGGEEYYDDEEFEPEQPQLMDQTAPSNSIRNPATARAFSADPVPQAQPEPAAPSKVDLPLPVLRKARKATRDMVVRCQQADPSQWEAIITEGILQETSVIQYMQAATIRRGLLECGADPQFAAQIIDAMNKSGLVPESIPRG